MALENPISSDLSHMRPSALPHLLAAAARNVARGAETVGLFEVGPGFHGAEPGEQTEQAAVLRWGATAPREWTGARRPVEALDARADAEAALAACGLSPDAVQITRDAPDWLHPGRSGAIKLGPKNTLAVFGELHPRVLEAFDLRGPAVACLVTLDAVPLPKRKAATRPALDASSLQAVDRDFAFVVPAETEAAAIIRAARGAERKHVADVTVFDVFDGPKAEAQLGAGMKSVAISVRLQPRDKTFTDETIATIADTIVEAVAKKTGATLRG
jgi:phenylalanyl-tRNA synthetase beta chain